MHSSAQVMIEGFSLTGVVPNYTTVDKDGKEVALFAQQAGVTLDGKPVFAPVVILGSIDASSSGSVRDPTLLRTTTAGTIAAGAITIAIVNVGDNSATVAGAELGQGEGVEWDAPIGDTLNEIDYDPTTFGGTTLLIETLT